MRKETVTWVLGVVGWVVSYGFFVVWLQGHGWDFFGGWREAFTASWFATGLLSDLVAVTFMVAVVAVWDRERIGTRWAVASVACLALSVSMALAVYWVGVWRAERGERAE